MREYLFQLLETSGGELHHTYHRPPAGRLGRHRGLFVPVLPHLPQREHLQHQVQRLPGGADHHHHDGDDRHRQQHRAVPGHGGRFVHRPLPHRDQGLPGHPLRLLGHCGGHLLQRGGPPGGLVGSAFVFAVLSSVGPHPQRQPAAADSACGPDRESKAEGLIFQYYARKAILRAKNTTPDSVEFIYPLNGKYLNRPVKPGRKGDHRCGVWAGRRGVFQYCPCRTTRLPADAHRRSGRRTPA